MKTTCKGCGGRLILLTSLNLKVCNKCGAETVWKLDPGQKPIFTDAPTAKKS